MQGHVGEKVGKRFKSSNVLDHSFRRKLFLVPNSGSHVVQMGEATRCIHGCAQPSFPLEPQLRLSSKKGFASLNKCLRPLSFTQGPSKQQPHTSRGILEVEQWRGTGNASKTRFQLLPASLDTLADLCWLKLGPKHVSSCLFKHCCKGEGTETAPTRLRIKCSSLI